MAKLGDATRLLRAKHNISQIQLSELMSIDKSYISAIEAGTRNPSFSTLEKIAAAFGKPLFLILFLMDMEDDRLPYDLRVKMLYEAMKIEIDRIPHELRIILENDLDQPA